MYKNLLIPTDGSELSERAIHQGVGLAKALGAKITFVAVRDPFFAFRGQPQMVLYMPDEFKNYVQDYVVADATKRLAAAKSIAEGGGVPCETLEVEHNQVHEGILETAADRGCDLIVMASHGHSGISAVVLGSETLKVLTHSTLPVLVCR